MLWTLRLCFSLVPAVFGFGGAALLLMYPDKKGTIIETVREFNALPRPHLITTPDDTDPSSATAGDAEEATPSEAPRASLSVKIDVAKVIGVTKVDSEAHESSWTPYLRGKVIVDPITHRATPSPDIKERAVGGSHIEWALDHFAAWEVRTALRCIKRFGSGGDDATSTAATAATTNTGSDGGVEMPVIQGEDTTKSSTPVVADTPAATGARESEGEGEGVGGSGSGGAETETEMETETVKATEKASSITKTKCDTWPLIVIPAVWLTALFALSAGLIAATAVDWQVNFKSAEISDTIRFVISTRIHSHTLMSRFYTYMCMCRIYVYNCTYYSIVTICSEPRRYASESAVRIAPTQWLAMLQLRASPTLSVP